MLGVVCEIKKGFSKFYWTQIYFSSESKLWTINSYFWGGYLEEASFTQFVITSFSSQSITVVRSLIKYCEMTCSNL